MNVVIGAGLTGLSAAYHLGGEALVLEKEAVPGGLCRSVTQDGFTFDLTGHLLHLRRPEIRDLVMRLVPEESFNRIDRRSFVHSHGLFTPYPFQVNTHGLPPEVVAECVIGYIEAVRKGEVTEEMTKEISFRDWALATFGAGIARHFMFPYNEKLWLTDLSEMTCEWVSWAVPRPSVRDVVEGALGICRRSFGYNPSFLYPRRGGIRVLADALAARLSGVRYGTEMVGLSLPRRTVTVREVESRRTEEIPYTNLISTIPLPHLLGIAKGLPAALDSLAAGLRHVAVACVNLGVARAPLSDMHWAYFPDPDTAFYRCGFPANLSAAVVPEGCSSLYVEISLRPDEPWDEDLLVSRSRDGLVRSGLLRPDDRLVVRRTFYISPAYVIYDRFRMRRLEGALHALESAGVRSVGRYGAWHYNSMEESLEEGMRAARAVRGGA